MADRDDTYRISDALWEQIEPLLPPELFRLNGGCPPLDNREAMQAILYVLRTDCGWEALPSSFGIGGAVYDRFQEWRKTGLFQRMWRAGFLSYDELRALIWHGKQRTVP